MTAIVEALRKWALRTLSRPQPRAAIDPPARKRNDMCGEYLSLYTYLANRYANVVVLTFAQIESLVGFALPERARTDREWWTRARTSEPQTQYLDAWILASRTAVPNL